MKTYSFQTKPCILILYMVFVCYVRISAQDTPVVDYLQQAKYYADIYNGRIEPVYSPMVYEDLPYYKNADFTDASFVYRDNYYPNQKVRLDLFKEQLIILPPEKRFGIIVGSQNVDRVFMYNRTFILLDPPKESGIKKGYYIQLLEGEKVKLFCKETYSIRQKQLTYAFDHKITYYLLYNNRYYTVKNKGSFSKLFPQYKKQINQYAKDHKLNFRQDVEVSLTSLAQYCEELITSTNK